MRQHGEECFDHTWRETIADDNAVNIAGIEMPGCCFDAERTGNPDALAHGDAEHRIKRATAGNQYSCIVECVANRQHWQSATVRSEQLNAAQHSGVERAHPHC